MRLNIIIKTGHVEEMDGRDLKKLTRALGIVIQTATGEIPKIETNVQHDTASSKIEDEEDPKVCSNCIYAYDKELNECPECGSNLTL